MPDDRYEFEQYKVGADPEYIASAQLANAVNTALAAEQPLVVTGDPGTGKTTLADSIARQLGLGPVLPFHTRSEHQGRDCLYTFDALWRLYDVQDKKEDATKKLSKYVRWGALGEAIRWPGPKPRVVLIDEIDKASRDFPNDLLQAVDEMNFTVLETGEKVACTVRPIVVITSNNERQLPEPFLRRCVFHYIRFPGDEELKKIIHAHLGALMRKDDRWRLRAKDLDENFLTAALRRFNEVREMGHGRPAATGELLAWVRVLLKAGVGAGELESRSLDQLHLGALVKLESDLRAFLEASPTPRAAGKSA